jgi:2'-5' RNA ligase
MPFAIELFFDTATDEAVRRVWSALAEQRIAPYLHESANRPHISLAVYEWLDVAGCARTLEAFAAQTPAFPVILASFGVFPTNPAPVVFAAPVVTSHLLALHAGVCAVLASVAREPAAYYLPGRWVPHCSLAVHFPAERINSASTCAGSCPCHLTDELRPLGPSRPGRPDPSSRSCSVLWRASSACRSSWSEESRHRLEV